MILIFSLSIVIKMTNQARTRPNTNIHTEKTHTQSNTDTHTHRNKSTHTATYEHTQTLTSHQHICTHRKRNSYTHIQTHTQIIRMTHLNMSYKTQKLENQKTLAKHMKSLLLSLRVYYALYVCLMNAKQIKYCSINISFFTIINYYILIIIINKMKE